MGLLQAMKNWLPFKRGSVEFYGKPNTVDRLGKKPIIIPCNDYSEVYSNIAAIAPRHSKESLNESQKTFQRV
jgi:hypothetical protein